MNLNFYLSEMQGQGGVHSLRMRREKMAGVNLREGIMEVALEQWTERTWKNARTALIHQLVQAQSCGPCASRLQRFSHVTGKRYRMTDMQR